MNIGIILAGGSGRRMGGEVPKQYMELGGKPLIWYALDVFGRSDIIDGIILVTGEGDIDRVREEIIGKFGLNKITAIIEGGSERYFSVLNALHYMEESHIDAENVFIQDGARPFADGEMLKRLYADVKEYRACVAAVPSKDTVKLADAEGFVETTPARERVWNIQTPQVFEYELIKEAYFHFETEAESLSERGIYITDDASVCERYTDIRVKLTMGSYENIKITTPDDIVLAENILSKR